MKPIYINAVAVAAPGLSNWAEAQTVLRGESVYSNTPLAAFTPTVLPANEQRRATATVRLAFRVAEEAIKNAQCSADSIATVFASSDADMMVSHRICTALASPQRLVSPTDFHNSVHNAPSGYWHIGAHSRLPSTAIAGHNFSFAIGFLEAITQTQMESHDTLLVCYDVPAPEPLLEKRPLASPCAMAILLSHSLMSTTLATMRLSSLNSEADVTRMRDAQLEALRLGNPAGRALPLLELLAQRKGGTITLQRAEQCSMSLDISIA